MVVRIGVVIERALRRTLLTPGLEGYQVGKRRDVVALAGFHHLLRRLRRGQMPQQGRGGRLVLAERPRAPEERQEGPEPTLWPGRHTMMPTLLGHLRRIAHRYGPGAWRVHDQSALARHQPLIVGGIVPGRRVLRIKLCKLGAIL